jgi:hypothetical protein
MSTPLLQKHNYLLTSDALAVITKLQTPKPNTNAQVKKDENRNIEDNGDEEGDHSDEEDEDSEEDGVDKDEDDECGDGETDQNEDGEERRASENGGAEEEEEEGENNDEIDEERDDVEEGEDNDGEESNAEDVANSDEQIKIEKVPRACTVKELQCRCASICSAILPYIPLAGRRLGEEEGLELLEWSHDLH